MAGKKGKRGEGSDGFFRQARSFQRNRIKDWYEAFKKQLRCSVCKESREPCLDFHHVDPKTKFMEVRKMMRGNFTLEKVIEEVKKCVILCANCHRMHHYAERIKKQGKK